MSDAEAWDRLWAVAEALGIPVSKGTTARGECPWDGSVLHGKTSDDNEGICDWWHEIGHFLVAPEEGLSLKGWGSGAVYDCTPGGAVLPDAALEEDASAVGIWCQAMLGHDEATAREHAAYHSWEDSDWLHHLPFLEPTSRQRAYTRLTRGGFPTPWTS